MFYKKAKVLAFMTALLCCTAFASSMRSSSATGSNIPADWFADSMAITKVVDLPAAQANTNRDCNKSTMLVANQIFQQTFEEHCYIPTVGGLMEEQGQYIKPVGYSTVYPLVSNFGGHPLTIPIANQAGALWMTGSTYGQGVTLSYFKNLYGHLNFSTFYQRFEVTSPADLTFSYKDGRPIQFDFGTYATDPNGRYLIVDTIFNGFVRIDTLNLEIKPFAESFARAFGVMPYTGATAINSSGKLAALSYSGTGNQDGTYFKIVDVDSCTGTGLGADAYTKPEYSCHTVDILPRIKQAIPRLVEIRNVRFANDRTVTFTALSSNDSGGLNSANYVMTADGLPASLIQYEALGDSFISGEGAFSYRSGTDTERNGCHQSLVSYPYLLGSKVSSFASVACSGARMQNVVQVEKDKKDQLDGGLPSRLEQDEALNNHLPGVLLQNTFVLQDNPEAISLSIGGNDVGFADIIEQCINPFQGSKYSIIGHLTCYNDYESRLEVVNTINDQFIGLRDLYESLKAGPTGPRRVYVTGYPQVLKPGGDCGINVKMNAAEVLFAQGLTDYLNSVIKQAANEAGVQFVDTRQTFDGHRLCETSASQTAVNGITFAARPTKGPDIKGSFHPNALGHELLAGSVASQTNNLTKLMPAATPKTNQFITNPNVAVLQGVIHTGRPVRRVNPNFAGLGEIVRKGLSQRVTVGAQSYFTKPGGTYTVAVGNNAASLGSFTADAAGNVDIDIAFPATTPTGFQTIHIYGNDVFGNPIDLQQVVYVIGSDTDYDDDTVANAVDSCPLISQSEVDADKDGIDDACDPVVTKLPIVVPSDEIIWHDNSVLRINISASRPQTTANP